MSETIASRAILMFCTEPRIWTCLAEVSFEYSRRSKLLQGVSEGSRFS
jgi:hypothetical protein